MRLLRRLIAVVSTIALLPFLIIILAVILSSFLGCEVNESNPQTCMAYGMDWSGVLSGMVAWGWIGLVTIPLLMCVYLVWLAIEAFVHWRTKRKQRRLASREIP